MAAERKVVPLLLRQLDDAARKVEHVSNATRKATETLAIATAELAACQRALDEAIAQYDEIFAKVKASIKDEKSDP